MALPNFGTMTTYDQLASSQQTIAQIGLDAAWDGIASLLNDYNAMSNEMIGDFCERTTSRLRRYGGAAGKRMQEGDEFSVANAQKGATGALCGFPLRKFELAEQWTRRGILRTPANQFAAEVEMSQTADRDNLMYQIKKALFVGTNYNFDDFLVDHQDQIPLPVRALVNADGLPIPPGPNGLTFDGSTHNHYLSSATLTNSWLESLIDTVIEHFAAGQPVLYINKADESAVRNLADFHPYIEEGMTHGIANDYANGTLDTMDPYNRAIGRIHGAEVWVKPWMIASYFFCYVKNIPQKPLVFRIEGVDTSPNAAPMEGAGDFQMVFQDEREPLIATGYERIFGIGVWTRTNGAIGYVGGDGSVYVQPALSNYGIGS